MKNPKITKKDQEWNIDNHIAQDSATVWSIVAVVLLFYKHFTLDKHFEMKECNAHEECKQRNET